MESREYRSRTDYRREPEVKSSTAAGYAITFNHDTTSNVKTRD